MYRFTVLIVLLLSLGAEAQRRGGRRPAGRRPSLRQGRQEAAAGDYSAPEEVPLYGAASDAVDTYQASDAANDPLAALASTIPGVPGEDYPIYSEVPETAFACDGQVDGGYYADPEAECQVFHICTADGAGGLAKYSFLCPNGTIFNQNYFICDWWFNFDCSEAAAIAEAKNSELAAAREAAAAAIPADEAASASESEASYAAPAVEEGYLAPNEEYDDYEEENQAAYGDSQSSYTQRRRS